MSAFHEVTLDSGLIIYETDGGPTYQTDVVITESGRRYRNSARDEAIGRWDYGARVVDADELEYVTSFFRARKGRAIGFCWKDWNDYQAALAQGRLGRDGVGDGTPTYLTWKRYADAGGEDLRRIFKPTALNPYRNGSPVTIGASPGQASIDLVAGTVTFVADATQAITGHTPGASHVFTTAGDLDGLIVGRRIYITGVTGSSAATLNDRAHEITGKSGSGPYVWTIAAVTTGLAATGGTAAKYPQAVDTLAWYGTFVLPVTFDTDELRARFKAHDKASGRSLYELASLPIMELIDL